ncbi:hypothetical protein JCM8097_003410 [Rhodosporidiobolus ruineniae]
MADIAIAQQLQLDERKPSSPSVSDADEKHSLRSSSGSKEAAAAAAAGIQRVTSYTHKSRGVVGVEAMARSAANSKQGKYALYALAVLIFILQWVAAMASSMTYSLSVYATSSFAQHSTGLSALSVASSIIGSTCLPFISKLSDVFGRPHMYLFCMVIEVVGYIISLKSPTLAAYVVGNVFSSIGSNGFALLNSIIMADLTPLKWRAFAMGALNVPYLCTVWYTAEIVDALSAEDKWRWGYGMFAIIYPVIWIPACAAMYWLESRALKDKLINVEVAQTGADDALVAEQHFEHQEKTFMQKVKTVYEEVDTIGLILLGFGWSLLLLPFSLYGGADGGFKNRSLIAMLAVGSACLVAYPLYEWKFAKFPSMPKRILFNRSFITAVVINVVYMIAAYLQLLYLASYVYITQDIDIVHWGYYNNIQNMGLCGVAIIAGYLFKVTGRFKFWQIFGLGIRIIGYGLLVDKNGVRSYAKLCISQLFAGAGSAFSSLGSQVAAQASVPHQDLALVCALLLLWSSVGAAIGDAVAGQHWGATMPTNLRKYIPVSAANDTEILGFYGDITQIRAYDWSSVIRQGATRAYEVTVFPLWSAALGLSFICLIAACLQKNYKLDDRQNGFDDTDVQGHVVARAAGEVKDVVEKKTGWQRVWRVWDL